ncbi:MAG: nuclear transport factor 2 family protein [Pyrinomonadaceae bacterium]
MRTIEVLFVTLLFGLPIFGQGLLDPVYGTQRAFEAVVEERGIKPALMEFLAEDAVIFRPEAVNGREFLKSSDSSVPGTLRRKVNYADVSINGLLAYTIGEWTFTPKARPKEIRVGEYATVWSKVDGRYKAILDIEISHEVFGAIDYSRRIPEPRKSQPNKQGWSAADATMRFLKMSMSKAGLGGAYDAFAAEDVILLRDGLPPIVGRGRAEEELERYIAADFPQKVSQFETGDMAYSWNACSYADSNEGMEKGNCLHVWKFRDKKWYIILGVFAKIENTTIPILKDRLVPRK